MKKSEIERLALLAEECGEIQQIVGKILRHGFDSQNPLEPNSLSNRRHLEIELGDMKLVIKMLIANKDVNEQAIDIAQVNKAKKIRKWLHFNHKGIDNEQKKTPDTVD